MPEPGRHHLCSIDDLDDEQLWGLVSRGVEFADGRADAARPLDGAVVGVLFRATSTRTRTAFSAGALRLGGQLVTYGPQDLQDATGETLEDTTRVLSRMLDVLVVRSPADDAEVRTLAGQPRMAVVNAMSAAEHPTQALADLTTLTRRLGALDGVRVLYVGEGNNTASALTLALSRVPGARLDLRTPPGYGVGRRFLDRARANGQRSGAVVEQRHDMADLPDVDVVYTTRWQTTGTQKPTPQWREAFVPFRVDSEVLGRSSKALFMHDLPAHRGDEVTAEVLDGPASIAFDQAEDKYHSARAVLEWCVGCGPAS